MTVRVASFRSTSTLRRSAFVAALTGAALAAGPALAAPPKIPAVKFGVEKCVPTTLAKYPGEVLQVLQVLLKLEDGKPVWEIEVEQADGKLWDVECSGATGKIVETEQRFKSADDPAFKAKAKITEAEATALVLAKHPGKVESIEYELEDDGTVVYEFDLVLANGDDARVEIEAATSKIKTLRYELVEIGRMPK